MMWSLYGEEKLMGMMNVEQSADEPQKSTFVPGDICVIVTSDIRLDAASRAVIYDTVQGALSRALDPVKIPPLERREGEPTFFFDDDENGGTTAHLYYRQAAPKGGSDAARAEAVRDAVVALNVMYVLPTSPPDIFRSVENPALRKLKIAAVAPHWIGAGCPEFDSDGPAAPPEPVDAPTNPAQPENWRFRFVRPDGSRGNTALQGFVDSARLAAAGNPAPSNVIVAILDTCPTNDAIHHAFTQFPGNSLLGQVGDPLAPPQPHGNSVSIVGSLVDTTFESSLVQEILPIWLGGMDVWLGTANPATANDPQRLKGLCETEYAIPDHGLFVAGIIKDIAPTAEIHLVRALEDTGITTLVPFVRTLQATLDQPWAKRSHTHLIISLSLTFSVPTYDEFKQEWAVALDGLGELKISEIYVRIHRNLKDVIADLARRNVLVVAAVGNYNEAGAARPEPRYPAIYDRVLAVAAVSREERAARYTNRGETLAASDADPVANGIATLGGDTGPRKGPRMIEREWREAPDAIRGLYSSMTFPLASTVGAVVAGTAGSNETGWVWWVGTSFATPVIAAVAALLWAEESRRNPTKTIAASKMIGIVQGYADTQIATQGSLGCATIFAEQELIP